MTQLATIDRIPAVSLTALNKVRELEQMTLAMPQVDIATHHVLHGGVYARTICIPKGVLLTSVHIKVPTTLIFCGHAVFTTNDVPRELCGYHVIPASANRKMAYYALADTHLTMVFKTSATSIAEAEDEFTDEAYLLFSRNADAQNFVNVTGE